MAQMADGRTLGPARWWLAHGRDHEAPGHADRRYQSKVLPHDNALVSLPLSERSGWKNMVPPDLLYFHSSNLYGCTPYFVNAESLSRPASFAPWISARAVDKGSAEAHTWRPAHSFEATNSRLMYLVFRNESCREHSLSVDLG